MAAALPVWTYSPIPAVEEAVQYIRKKYPATYPAGLDRVRQFLGKLGNPHLQLPFTFHVAGTNGKGSTLAFLQAICEAGGLTVHKFISPHLVRFEERILVGGEMIGADLLLSLIDECDRAEGEVSFFEFFTAVAFLAYARNPADVLLLETGLGGLYDATNVVEGPRLIALQTRISYDHTHILGDTLEEIAFNKAGIIKAGCPCVVAPQQDEAFRVFINVAKEKPAPVFAAGYEWQVTADLARFEYRSAAHQISLPLPALQGRHQIDNAGTAIAAVAQSPYVHLMQPAILEKAMQDVRWPGRMQHITEGRLAKILPAGWELWLDGAHNDSGAEILLAQMKRWGGDLPLHLVTAMKQTKDINAFFQPLFPHVSSIQAVDVSWIEAPMIAAESLCDQMVQAGYKNVQTVKNLETALHALTFQFKTPQRILITGSLYLVGHALKEQQ